MVRAALGGDHVTDALLPLVAAVRARLRRRLAWLAARAEALGEPADSLLLVLEPDEVDAEAAWCADQEGLTPLLAPIDTFASDPPERWVRLVSRLGLSPFDAQVLKVAVACAAEPGLRRVFAALEGWRGRAAPSIAQIGRLYAVPDRALPGDAAVLRWELVRADGEGVAADPAIVAWLGGGDLADPELVGAARIVPVREPLANWPLDSALRVFTSAAPPVRLRIVGTAGSGRRTFAASLAAGLPTPATLVAVEGGLDLDPTRAPEVARLRWRRACRLARLDDRLLAWVGPVPDGVDASLAPDRVVLVLTPHDTVASHAQRIDPVVDLPLPDIAARRDLWLAAIPAAAGWPAPALAQLAAAHRVTVAEVGAVGALGVTDLAAVSEAVRAAGRGAIGGLAQRLACTFTLDDLIGPAAVRGALDDFLFEARERLLVWEDPALRRLFPMGTGLMALFCGPPGTGKTMAAQVLARELGLDLYRIDLASVVSKYVGETAKNLERVLASAARMDVVLFFDEADALFGKRTEIRDAHDRYANTDTNYLLQAIESYPGIALLATNRKGNVDGAFLRRLRHVVEFPAPDATLRLRLWDVLVTGIGGDAARASTVSALPTLAACFELSGAQIKYAVLHSLYTARREQAAMGVRHLVGGVERELLKEGRGIGRVERERLLAFERAA